MTVAVVDCGIGNLRSVCKALEATGADVVLSADRSLLADASHLVVPGVGAFGDFMSALGRIGVDDLLHAQVADGVPVLGICVGMQVLFEEGLEFGRHRGLGFLPGRVARFDDSSLVVPHVGWNQAAAMRPDPLFDEAGEPPWFYFVHSFRAELPDGAEHHVVASTDYGGAFPSAVRAGSLWGVQFHPEKSQRAGLDLLGRFVRLPSPLTDLPRAAC